LVVAGSDHHHTGKTKANASLRVMRACSAKTASL
jgi:hypothetical protein